MGGDEQMRGIQTIDQVHLRPGDEWKGTIRCGVFKQSTSSCTPWRGIERGGQMRGIQTNDKVHIHSGDR